MTPDRSTRCLRIALPLALPVLVIVLSLFVWVTGVAHSGFWADDFSNIAHFDRTLGDLSNDRINTGKYFANVFWAIGTIAFGTGSVVPFLLLNSLVFGIGLATWLGVGRATRWTGVDAWWIAALFAATAAWLPTALWSSNIVHSGGFLALGAALFTHERAMKATTAASTARWSVACGVAWTFGVASDVLYIGLLVLAAYCAWHQLNRLRDFQVTAARAAIAVGFWNLAVPLIYFATVAYPGTTSSTAYSNNGLQFVHPNLRYYRSLLSPTPALTTIYAVLLVGAAAGGLVALRRKNLFPMALLIAAGATAMPALVQSQQRDIHYMAMPLLLLFSSIAAARPLLLSAISAARPALFKDPRRLGVAFLIVACTALLFIFRQGADVRAFFVQSPYGEALATFRSEAAALVPAGGVVCARLNLDPPHQSLFIAELSGPAGFLLPPISAAQAFFETGISRCPAGVPATRITVGLDPHGDFVASA